MSSDSGPRRLLAVACLAAAFSVGCSRSPYDIAPASGTVLLNGAPVTAGKVMFAPQAQGDSLKSGKAAIGDIDPNGSFVLRTYGKRDGAVVAQHAVTLLVAEGDGGKATRVLLPGLLEVAAGEDNEFTIELTSETLEKYGVRK